MSDLQRICRAWRELLDEAGFRTSVLSALVKERLPGRLKDDELLLFDEAVKFFTAKHGQQRARVPRAPEARILYELVIACAPDLKRKAEILFHRCLKYHDRNRGSLLPVLPPILQYQRLSIYDNLVHGFSTRTSGDMSNKRYLATFLSHNNIDITQACLCENSGNRIRRIDQNDRGKTVQEAVFAVVHLNTFIVLTYDRELPVIVYDPGQCVVGITTARGAQSPEIEWLVEWIMNDWTCKKEELYIAIGPPLNDEAYWFKRDAVDWGFVGKESSQYLSFFDEYPDFAFFDIVGQIRSTLAKLEIPASNIITCQQNVSFPYHILNDEHYEYEVPGEKLACVVGIRSPS